MSKNFPGDLKYLLKTPFVPDDLTCGCENEFQVAVEGSTDSVDLPAKIINSRYYQNLIRRVKSGDTPSRLLKDLEDLIFSNNSNIWENSWVRIEKDRLSEKTRCVFTRDLLKDKSNPSLGFRNDAEDFFFYKDKKCYIRVPVSYLLKLVLIDFYNTFYDKKDAQLDGLINFLTKNFINDNTSPEVTSFYISKDVNDIGYDVAKENAKRFLFIQLLVHYANHKFGLINNNQKVYIYNSPNTPIRQKKINALIPDELYRELFISPCLSGWDRGEEKKNYMFLCHSVLSKSKINTLKKLKDAGFIKSNLVVIPDTSNTCLANNGTHISVGSKQITELLRYENKEFNELHEKYYGDLVIKIIEHFLPLFPGIYSGSPYRLSFNEMHPELATGFLAHELDFTHLRMIWRRWQKKADLKRFQHIISPTGLELLDYWLSKIFRLNGDYVCDYRLIDYFIALMSTENSPAFNGEIGNQEYLKKELHSLGIFHKDMAFYCLYRMRSYEKNGFSGFEGRYYSNFESLFDDLKNALNLQALITALAYKYFINNQIAHFDIPDTPFNESERRQIFFCSAIGIPTFYVSIHTQNNFLKKILSYTKNTRLSRRYPGYVRVYLKEYLNALIKIIENDGGELLKIEPFKQALEDCKERINNEKLRTDFKLIKKLLDLYKKKNPVDIPAEEFNYQLENYYWNELRIKTIKEGVEALIEDIDKIDFKILPEDFVIADRESIKYFIKELAEKLISDTLTQKELYTFLSLIFSQFYVEIKKRQIDPANGEVHYGTSVY